MLYCRRIVDASVCGYGCGRSNSETCQLRQNRLSYGESERAMEETRHKKETWCDILGRAKSPKTHTAQCENSSFNKFRMTLSEIEGSRGKDKDDMSHILTVRPAW